MPTIITIKRLLVQQHLVTLATLLPPLAIKAHLQQGQPLPSATLRANTEQAEAGVMASPSPCACVEPGWSVFDGHSELSGEV